MSELTFQDLDILVANRLNHIQMLSNDLKNLLNKDKKGKRRSLDILSQKDILQQPSLMNIAAKEGIRSIEDYVELKEKDPERVERIFKQSNLRSLKALLIVNINLIEETYPDIVWSSLNIMSFSVFESNVKIICRYLRQFLKLKLDISDMSGNSILERGKNYFQNIQNLNYDFSTSQLWEKIRGHQSVRNLIAHNGSIIDDTGQSKRVVHFVKYNDTALEIHNKKLILKKEYITEITNDFKNWLEEFLKVVLGNYPDIKNFNFGA